MYECYCEYAVQCKIDKIEQKFQKAASVAHQYGSTGPIIRTTSWFFASRRLLFTSSIFSAGFDQNFEVEEAWTKFT